MPSSNTYAALQSPHMGDAPMLYGYGLDTLQQRLSGQSRMVEGCSDWAFGTAMLHMRACVRVSVCKIQEHVRQGKPYIQ